MPLSDYITPTEIDLQNAAHNNSPIGCGHIRPLYTANRYREIIRHCIKALKPHAANFTAIAITGYSSALIAPSVALRLRKNICLVRKDSEQRASAWAVEGLPNQKYVFIDDLISTGKTLQRVIERMNVLRGTLYGVYLYNDGDMSWDREGLERKLVNCSNSGVKLLNPA